MSYSAVHHHDRQQDDRDACNRDQGERFTVDRDAEDCRDNEFHRTQHRHFARLFEPLDPREVQQVRDGRRDQAEQKPVQQDARVRRARYSRPRPRHDQNEDRREKEVIGRNDER